MSSDESTIRHTLGTPWRRDFANVEPALRRAARYVLQMMARCPNLLGRIEDRSLLAVAWSLVLPLVDVAALARIDAERCRPDSDPEDKGDVKSISGRGLLPGAAGERMCDDLVRWFTTLPDALLTTLAASDGCAPTHPSVAVLARSVGLDCDETAVLDFLEKKQTVAEFGLFLRWSGFTRVNDKYASLGAALDLPVAQVKRALRRSSPLRTLHLVDLCHLDCNLEDFLKPEDLLQEILTLEPTSEAELLSIIVESPITFEVSLADFPHLSRDAERLTCGMKTAVGCRAKGVNALLYGPPGAGKTQFAQAVAAAAGLTAYRVRTADQDGYSLSRKGRLGAYQLAQRLLGGRSDCIVIFDDVEDAFENAGMSFLRLFSGEMPSSGEKGWMNRTLEENPVPAIWITNDVESMDPAFLRRFLLPVPFTVPPRKVRRRIAEHHLGGTGVPSELLDELAADSALLPAQFGAARRLLDLQPGANPETVVREGMAASRRLLHGSPAPRSRQAPMPFDVAFLNLAGGITPVRLLDALGRRGRASLCFVGPPGTGKTEFAHILADALDRELIVRSCSDLVSPYIGQTEKNLARLFVQIDVGRSVLFLDEVDSFLRDRRSARYSWETTEVNELLQQMECFPGIFVAATNLVESLDTAALRRFDFKLQFRPLTPAQRRSLFAREAMGHESHANDLPSIVSRKLDALDMLTPGDFANVVRQRDLLDEPLSPEDFVRRLMVECRWKANAGLVNQAS